MADLRAIPVTSRAQLQQLAPKEIVSRLVPLSHLHGARTSGSSGIALTIYRSRAERWFRKILNFRTFRHYGVGGRDGIVTINGWPTGATAPIFKTWTKWPLWNLWLFDEPDRMIEWLRKLKPAVIYGFASNLAIVASRMVELKIDDITPRILATSSEVLTAGYREVLKRAFNVDPFDIYSCTEVGTIGWQCQMRRGLHVNADWMITEVLKADARRCRANTAK